MEIRGPSSLAQCNGLSWLWERDDTVNWCHWVREPIQYAPVSMRVSLTTQNPRRLGVLTGVT